jgi:hypothetical protein
VVRTSQLLRDAATILEPVKDEVVVVGALAVHVALDGHEVTLAPTRDIDAGIDAADARVVVGHLEREGLRPSEIEHESGFTWVKDEVKVQLMAPFNPVERKWPPARGLPTNNLVGELEDHRWLVAFDDDPDHGCFYAARPAALVALKEAAFGRTRPGGESVDRDYSDVALLFDRLHGEIVGEALAFPQMRIRVARAAKSLTETRPREAAGRELVANGEEESQKSAEAMVGRAARALIRDLGE